MTLWHYALLSYSVVVAVFAVLLSTSEDWRAAALEQPEWPAVVIRFFLALMFGCLWPFVMFVWALSALGFDPW